LEHPDPHHGLGHVLQHPKRLHISSVDPRDFSQGNSGYPGVDLLGVTIVKLTEAKDVTGLVFSNNGGNPFAVNIFTNFHRAAKNNTNPVINKNQSICIELLNG
jgi:hypothetical protein